MSSSHPHIIWRKGRPRFSPGPALRAAGHKGRDLIHAEGPRAGQWFTRGECVDWSIAFRASLPKPEARKPGTRATVQHITVGKMVEQWQLRSARWLDGPKQMAANTRRDYLQKLKVLQDDFWTLWCSPAIAVQPHHLQACYDQIEQRRGLATARGSITVLGIAYKWAITRGVIRHHVNPAAGLDKSMPKPRIRFATREEVAALIAAADRIGLPQIGDCIMLGLWTGQRQADRLALKAHDRIGRRRVFKQAKTGAIVHILEAPELEARIAASALRRKASGIIDPHVILMERDSWKPYGSDHYRHHFAMVRKVAAKGLPSLNDFHDADLRDTAVTWMALAGATIPEIASVTGHSAETVHQIMKHYLAMHPAMADEAIRKMITWYDAGGETEIG
jgi:integrase